MNDFPFYGQEEPLCRIEFAPRFLDIHAVVSRSMNDRTRIMHRTSAKQLRELVTELPRKGESYRIISGRFGFSACDLVERIGELRTIKSMKCSTLRVGEAHYRRIISMLDAGTIAGFVLFATSNMQKRTDSGKYDYIARMDDPRVKMVVADNHSKIVLLDCGEDKLTIETSSNFNENPKIEQFCITNDAGLFAFYDGFFDALEEAAADGC